MKRTARAIALVAVLGMLGGLALSGTALGQSDEPSGSDSAEPITFIIGLTNNIITVNPLRAIEAPEYELFAMQYDLLFNFSKEDMSAVPGLATEIPTKENGGLSEDGLTWTIKIRDDAVWSDGEPLTAKDIAFTYNLVLDQNWSNFTNYLPFTDSIEATDDTTLVWKTTKPSIAPLIPPWIYILPQHIWGGMSKDEIKKFENFDPDTGAPVTSGPFQHGGVEQGRGLDARVQRQLLGRHPDDRPRDLQALHQRRDDGAGPEAGRDRLRRGRARSTCSRPCRTRRASPRTSAARSRSRSSASTSATCRTRARAAPVIPRSKDADRP